jgi:carbon-monoxide dehydrogenase catalytic subunit
LSCQLCSHGPCRINEKSDMLRGVCGIDADAMAIRKLLLQNAMGAATYAHHAYQAFKPRFRNCRSLQHGSSGYSR